MIGLTVKVGQIEIRSGAFIAGLVVVVLGALMVAEGVVDMVADTSFMFARDMNRQFELVVGFVAILLGAAVMGLSRSQLTGTSQSPVQFSTGQPQK